MPDQVVRPPVLVTATIDMALGLYTNPMSSAVPFIVILVAAVLAFVAGAVVARRKGYKELGEVVVRCRRGHLFATDWKARASVHRIDIGFARIQRCTVGDHWSVVVPVKDSELTAEERRVARQNRDETLR